MKTSDHGIDFIKSFEGFSAVPYKDNAGRLSIGYGHLIKPGETFSEIDIDSAIALLRADLETAEDAVNELVAAELNQNQFDALVSFTYNLGRERLAGSTLLKLLNAGDYAGASAQFVRWSYIGTTECDGLKRRRMAEAGLFSTPISTPDH